MSQRSMVPLAIFGGLLIAGVAVLWLMMRDGDDASAEPTEVTNAEPAPTPTVGAEPTTPVTPSLPAETPRAGSAEGVKEYMVGDRKVRDHRTGNQAPIDIPPAVHPPDARKITSNLTHEIGQKLKVIVKDCAASLPAGARSKSSRLEGQVVIAIKAKQVTVSKAVVQLRDVDDASIETVKQCIEDKALTVTHTAEENDLESYDINLSYSL